MNLVRTCPSCATPLPGGSSYCHQCGAATPTEIAGEDGRMTDDTLGDFAEAEYRARFQHALGDDYQLGELIGRGGFGAVYRAYDVKLDRTVAVKALRHDLFPTPDMIERFRREAHTIAKLRHPNVIPIYTVGEGEGLVFMIMPFIDGGNLRELLRREGALSIEEATRIVADAARALQAAHDAGIVHRDVKPDNVLLEGDERRVLLTDFGIAKALAGDATSITGSGTILGTPAYLSPEQAAGEREIGPASDVYSLGVVAYEALAGRLPFDGETAQALIMQHMTANPKPIQKIRSDIPDDVADAVMRSLAKRPGDRLESATLADTLGRIAIITASQDIVPMRRLRWRAVMLAVVSVVGALAAVTAFSVIFPRSEVPGPEVSVRQLTFSGSAHSPAISSDGDWVAYLSAGAIRVREVAGGGATAVFTFDPSTDPVSSLGWSDGGVTILFDYGADPSGLMSVSRFGGPAVRVGPTSLARSRDGTRLLSARYSVDESPLLLVGPTDQSGPPDTVRFRLEVGISFVGDASWSPDGQWIALVMRPDAGDDSTVLAVVSPDGAGQESLIRRESWIRSLGWSSNSDAVYYSTGDAAQLTKIEIDPRTGRPRSPPQVLLDGVEGFAVSGDGVRLAYDRSVTVNHVWLIEAGDAVGGGLTRRSLTPGTASYGEPVISPDGQNVAALRDGEVYVIPVDGGEVRPITALATEINTLIWSPDGARVAFKASTADGWRPMVVAATGGTPRVVSGRETHPNRWVPRDMGWSADGSQLFYSSSDSMESGWRAVDINSGRDTAMLRDSTFWGGPVPSPDGRWVAASIEDRIEAVSLEDGRRRLVTNRLSDQDGLGDIPLHWSEDDTIYVARTSSGFLIRDIWAVPATGGPPSLYLAIPGVLLPNGTQSQCESISMAADARRLLCSAPATSSVDIWIADNFDPAAR